MAVKHVRFQEIHPVIDAEFKAKIPKMPIEDREGLKADIESDRYIRDPLVIWQEENILLDGHHRWEIKSELGDKISDDIPVDYKSFSDRWAAIAWICANQLHKHNMTEMQRDKLIQEEHDARMKSYGGNRGTERDESGKFTASGPKGQMRDSDHNNIRNEIAKEHSISSKKVRNAVEVGRGIDKADEVVPGFKEDVLVGKVKVSKGDLSKMRKMAYDEIKEAVADVYAGKKPNTKSKPIEPDPIEDSIRDSPKQSEESETDESIDTSAYNIHDLIGEVNDNGDDYIRGLRTLLEHRFPQFDNKTNRMRLRNAISVIIEGFKILRSEYEDE